MGFTKQQIRVPPLDVDTQWNSTFEMIDGWFTFERVILHLCARPEFIDSLGRYQFDQMKFRALKSIKDFLSDAYDCTVAASGSSYATLSMQPMIHKRLVKLCEDAEAGRNRSGFTSPTVKEASSVMRQKFLKYEKHMCSVQNRMALLLDPRSSNAFEDAKNMKDLLRCTLRADYGFGGGNQQAASPVSVNKRSFDLFANDGDSDDTENTRSKTSSFTPPVQTDPVLIF